MTPPVGVGDAAVCCPGIPFRSKHLSHPCPALGMLAADTLQLGPSLELSLLCHVPFTGAAYTQGLVDMTYKGLVPTPQLGTMLPGHPSVRAAMGLADAFLASAWQFNSPLRAFHLHTPLHPCQQHSPRNFLHPISISESALGGSLLGWQVGDAQG